MRRFNTEGPVKPSLHYCVPPLDRMNLSEVQSLVRQQRYFVMHAPRQSGKTSTLLALRDLFNSEGAFRCVYASFEAGATARDDVERAMRLVLAELAAQARRTLGDDFLARNWREILALDSPDRALTEALAQWMEADPSPLVLLIDEIDALSGDSLLSVLRQFRSGYYMRPERFPQSVVLCGLRDVRDYQLASGGSPFNIKAKSLRLGDFSRAEVASLLAQHVTETGQTFSPRALALVWERTQGQPWLVNALASEACFDSESGLERSRTVTDADIAEAQERLVLQRLTHLDQLADKLKQARVRRVIGPLLSGVHDPNTSARDIEYVRDLGLIARDAPLRIANPIYAEVVPRELTHATQELLDTVDTVWYIDADGSLNARKLLAAFQDFFRKHSEHWVEGLEYKEAGPQLLLQAFLQRVVNGGGRVEREYGLGRGRTDLLITWPGPGGAQHFVIECKIRHGSLEAVIDEGIEQTAGYMNRCDATEGHLVIFDRSEGRSWDVKVFHRSMRSKAGQQIEIWGM